MESNRREDIVYDISNYYSYRYGLSETFSIYNVQLMKCFYLCFPIFRKQLLELNWEHYTLLFSVSDFGRRMFYFHICIFCKFTISQLQFAIEQQLYERI